MSFQEKIGNSIGTKLFVAAKAIIEYNGKILILRESGSYEDGTSDGRYDVCGGRLQPGEKLADALKREVREETGLEIEMGDVIAVNEWMPVVRGEQWQIIGIFFACRASSDQVRLSSDHDAYLWIDPTKYEEYPVIENMKPVFTKYVERTR